MKRTVTRAYAEVRSGWGGSVVKVRWSQIGAHTTS